MTMRNDEDVERLADECRFENARFLRDKESNPKPCFDLLRLALSAANPLAMDHVYAIYIPKMQWWASQYIGSTEIGEDPEYFAEVAFVNFYRASIGEQFDRKFESLPRLIRFMQACVRNLIWEQRRKNREQTL